MNEDLIKEIESFGYRTSKPPVTYTIYGRTYNPKSSFIIDGLDMWVDCRSQNGSGSTCEKYPYIIENAINVWQNHADTVVIIFEGDYVKRELQGCLDWIKGRLANVPAVSLMTREELLNQLQR